MARAGTIMTAMVAFFLGAAACTDDAVAPPEDLTEEEATNLLLGFRGLMVLDGPPPTIISETQNGVIMECPLGGQVEFIGTVPDEEFVGDTARLDLDLMINPTGCRISANGAEYVVSGDPGVHERFSVEIIGFFESFSMSGSTVGVLAWESEERSGRCEIDVSLTAEPDLSDPENPTVNGTVSGMLCGHEVSIDVDRFPFD